ncbi:enkurin [Harmonia axyridis]|uniref:enkurin n=1 Tax=Harmonia axyridis TaxID=115357 RepID=UPI001E275A1C|nr:enkurin [Harmonia axyridis]
MSVIYLKNHDENIYSITTKPVPLVKKSPRYRSKYADYVRKPNVYSTICKESHKSMGKPVECLPNPKDFLRKGTGKQPHSRCRPYDDPKLEFQKKGTCYPTRDEVKKFNEEMKKKEDYRNSHNFVSSNIKKVLELKSKIPEKKVAFNNKGDSRPLIREVDPIYIYSKYYGKTPPYLQNYIENQHKEHLMKRDTEGVEQPKCRYITREDREKLLEGLKQNWEELQKQYQGLPILTDTIPKKIRKTKMEEDLKQLEKDIGLVERHPYIYVYDDDSYLTKK